MIRIVHKALAALIFLFLLSISGLVNAQSDLEIIKERLYQEFLSSLSVTSNDNRVAYYLSTQHPDGSWSDIDYQAPPSGIWSPANHPSRFAIYARSYSDSLSTYYNSPSLLSRIEKTISYWLDLNLEMQGTAGWWFYNIGIPRQIGDGLIALQMAPTGISSEMENDMVAWMKKGRPWSDFSSEGGTNLIDVAQQRIKRACIINDDNLLSETLDVVFTSIKVDPEIGIQVDHSFKEHGSQLYTYGYGRVFAEGIGVIGNIVKGTSFAIPAEKMAIFSNFMRIGFLKPVRGEYVDFNLFGRGVSRPNITRTFPDLVKTISEIDLPKYAEKYADAVARMKGEMLPSYNIEPEHFHYWETDYSLHIRSKYTFGLRSVSSRTVQSETGNGENLKGHFLTEGVTYIGVKGDEYYNIFPTWDWNKIPGTTTPEITYFPSRAQWGNNKGKTSFVGGVSNGIYGVSTYSMDDYNTKAKKSWFFFDDEIVCLGSGIEASASQAINTTLNQCHLTTDVNIGKTTGTTELLPEGLHTYAGDLKWVTQGNVGYLFPNGGNINLSNQTQTGTWYSINTTMSDDPVSNDVFKLWFTHGVKPQDASYVYFVLPGKGSPDAMHAYDASQVRILSNSKKVQAVLHQTLNLLQVVFYEPGNLQYDDITLTADKACTVMLTNPESDEVTVFVSDPSQQHSNITLGLQNGLLAETHELTLDLPDGDYAGSTVSGKIEGDGSVSTEKDTQSDGLKSDEKVFLYPNPLLNGQVLHRSNNEKITSFSVVSIDGEIVSKGKEWNTVQRWASKAATGFYIVQIRFLKGKAVNRRLIVLH